MACDCFVQQSETQAVHFILPGLSSLPPFPSHHSLMIPFPCCSLFDLPPSLLLPSLTPTPSLSSFAFILSFFRSTRPPPVLFLSPFIFLSSSPCSPFSSHHFTQRQSCDVECLVYLTQPLCLSLLLSLSLLDFLFWVFLWLLSPRLAVLLLLL